MPTHRRSACGLRQVRESVDQLGYFDTERLRQLAESTQVRIVPSDLQAREIGAADAGLLRQRLLGESSILSEFLELHGEALRRQPLTAPAQ
jgi:hypothetical protein